MVTRRQALNEYYRWLSDYRSVELGEWTGSQLQAMLIMQGPPKVVWNRIMSNHPEDLKNNLIYGVWQ